ncbi:hypothetical protein pb186bvf_005818 [Paramecium bursaria]
MSVEELKDYIVELQQQLQEVERCAIDVIMEKDEIINQLRSAHIVIDQNAENFEISQLREQINQLTQRLDEQQYKHFEQIKYLEEEQNNLLLIKLSQTSLDYQEEKKLLMDQIRLFEDKNHKLELQIQIMENQEFSYQQTIQKQESQLQHLKDQELEFAQKINNYVREINQLTNLHKKEISQQEDKIQQLQLQVNQNSKHLINLRQVNQKLAAQNKEYALNIIDLMNKKQELESQSCQQEFTTQSTDVGYKEEVSITAFDAIDFDNDLSNDVKEKQQVIDEYEEYLEQSTTTIKQLKAQIQLMQQQLTFLRLQREESKKLSNYVKNIQQNKPNKISDKEDIINKLQNENLKLKQQLKQNVIKTMKKLSNSLKQ